MADVVSSGSSKDLQESSDSEADDSLSPLCELSVGVGADLGNEEEDDVDLSALEDYLFSPAADDLPDEVLSEEFLKYEYPDDSLYEGGLREMTEQEEDEYYTQILASDGFDVDCFPRAINFGLIKHASISPSWVRAYIRFAKAAVRFENLKPERKDDKLSLTGIVKANTQVCSPVIYYFTLRAKNSNGESNIYQAKVCERFPVTKTLFPYFQAQKALMTVLRRRMDT